MTAPIICFGQQPCGFFPKRFLFAKIQTARRLQSEIGGKIVFFFHDSDHDPRETRTVLHHSKTNEPVQLNFTFKNHIQRKFSPLYIKEITGDWQVKTARILPNYVRADLATVFRSVSADNAADFCLGMYRSLSLLDNVDVVRSSSSDFREAACNIPDFFADVPYENEIVRARFIDGGLKLHKGGNTFLALPLTKFNKQQISPTRDTRFRWMQSVVKCSHYIAGASEQDYLYPEENPEVTFIKRDVIDRSDEAYTEFP
ncbi:MAG: hypothetical protein JO025_19325 [Verrucomicrobia bacterium]|nr:hypothetical protein [Verrucomicrobiota bacterium]